MEINYRFFHRLDFIDLATLTNDEWKANHQNIAQSMLKSTGDIEKCLLAMDCEVGEIAGYVYGYLLPNKTLIPEFLFVKPKYRGYGIGKTLLSEFEIATGCTTSMVFYHKSLHDYYSKLGYQAGDALEVAIKEILT